jgi:hypothetical protein
MNILKKMIKFVFGHRNIHAGLVDIKGRKSGGIRDSNGADWKNPKNNSSM